MALLIVWGDCDVSVETKKSLGKRKSIGLHEVWTMSCKDSHCQRSSWTRWRSGTHSTFSWWFRDWLGGCWSQVPRQLLFQFLKIAIGVSARPSTKHCFGQGLSKTVLLLKI